MQGDAASRCLDEAIGFRNGRCGSFGARVDDIGSVACADAVVRLDVHLVAGSAPQVLDGVVHHGIAHLPDDTKMNSFVFCLHLENE